MAARSWISTGGRGSTSCRTDVSKTRANGNQCAAAPLTPVAQRRKLLDNLKKNDEARYNVLIAKLGLRR